MILSTIMVIGSIFLMLFGIIIGGDIGLSFNLPAAVLVIGLASLSTIGAKAVKTDLDSLQYFGESAVRAGWIAFFIGLVMTSGLLQNEANLIEFLPRAISIIFLGPLYGYVLNFLTKNFVTQIKSIDQGLKRLTRMLSYAPYPITIQLWNKRTVTKFIQSI